MFGSGGVPGTWDQVIDITERILAEEKIRAEADAQLKDARTQEHFSGHLNILSIADVIQLGDENLLRLTASMPLTEVKETEKPEEGSIEARVDADVKKIGTGIGGLKVFDIKDFSAVIRKEKIDVAVIAVPAEFAQSVLETVTNAGIKAVMNFAPTPLQVSNDIKVKSIDLTISLESLSYFLAQPVQ